MWDNLTNNQKKIIFIIGIVITIIVMFFIYKKADKKEIINMDDEILVMANSTSSDNAKKEGDDMEDIIVVHVSGAIKSPGVVKLKQGARIEDAIEKAGGLKDNADISNVNLAYVLEDGVKIIIPEKGDDEQTVNIVSSSVGDEIILKFNSNEEEKKTKVNINKASQSDLESLSGVGPSLASKIIDYRNNNGKFSNIEDIKNVSGIGDNKFEAIKDYICIK